MPGTAILVSLGVLQLLSALPNRVDALTPDAFLRVPYELPAILLILLVSPPRWRPLTCRLLAAATGAAVALKLADMAAHAALGRPFDPVLDLHLAAAGWDLLVGAIGMGRALLAAAAVAAVLAGAVAATHRALGVLARALPAPSAGGSHRVAWAGAAALLLAGAALRPPVDGASAGGLVYDRTGGAIAGLADLRSLRDEAVSDAFADVADGRLLSGLAGRDVLLVFVESYGRSAIEDPRYTATVGPALDAFETAVAARGLAIRSGWLTAPMVGGQSWLAHGSVLSGLWIDSQQRYDSLVAGEPRSLVRDFGRAGWRTVAAMPAITAPWPEGSRFGFDRIYVADDFGYRGAPFNWVTMPDQFTLAAFDRLELAAADRPPVMATMALISSHAPWTPVAPLLDWASVGDGTVFTPHAAVGDPPEVVWRDPERVRHQYALAVAYSLRTLAAYVEAYGRDEMVLILLGDHQPAPLITGAGASRDVPVHIVAAASVAEAAAGPWDWVPAARPGDVRPRRMDAFRERLLRAFTPPATPPAAPIRPETLSQFAPGGRHNTVRN
ncbi:hypothetical protein ABIE65_001678 [Constrictibacter sp. MBR-5]|uniref:hypothetical protein n=1 Tax=Constrictibacter sp. MBR-5 TaxID=3156467 RepID=UPI00339AAB13